MDTKGNGSVQAAGSIRAARDITINYRAEEKPEKKNKEEELPSGIKVLLIVQSITLLFMIFCVMQQNKTALTIERYLEQNFEYHDNRIEHIENYIENPATTAKATKEAWMIWHSELHRIKPAKPL